MEPMSPEKTSFSVETATIDDMETASRLQFEAIWPASPVDRAIYPLGMTDTALAAATATKKRKFGSGNVEYKKVVVSLDGGDTESETVAFARWYVWAEDRDASDWDKPYTFSPEEGLAPGDMNLTAAEIIYGTLYDAKKRGTGGKRHLYISLLATHPGWQGKGCGRLLMEEAVRTAKLHRINDIFLVSTASAYSWYSQYGFEVVSTMPFDLASLTGKELEEESRWSNMYLMRTTPA